MTITHTELLEIIRNGENSGVEFKRDDIQNHALATELVAFSNLEGGMVLLGVEKDGSISGITRDHQVLEEWVMTACRDKIRPGLIPFYEVIREVEPRRDVAIVRVTRGLDVHTLWHHNRNAYYIRVGTQSREPTPEELSRLFQQRGNFRVELRPVSGATMDDLDRRRLKNYFTRVRQQDVPADDDDLGWQTLLFNTEIMVDEGITVSGILLFGRNPNRFLPQAGIDASAFPGKSKDYAAHERTALRGPITPLLDDAGEIVEAGLVEQAIAFVQRNTSVVGKLEENGGRREIISPGRLPNGITPARMLTGCRASRNQLIKDVMRDYRYLEHSGMGVPRKIVKSMKAHNGTAPELIDESERFTIRLLNRV
jgi:ATP-dependent DNA helicase RecG